MNSCHSCQRNKRKCDRGRPSCSTCIRVGRRCAYGDNSTLHDSNRTGASVLPTVSPISGIFGTSVGLFNQQGTFDKAMNAELLKVLGNSENIYETFTTYFNSSWKKLPIISRRRLPHKLQRLQAGMPADLSTLCLLMYLIEQKPEISPDVSTPGSMRTPLYLSVKTLLVFVEATGYYRSIEFLQSQILMTFYEIGHDIDAAASSIASCAKLARMLNLHKKSFQTLDTAGNEALKDELEERKRVWWAIINLERYIHFRNGDPLFSAEDPKSNDILPVEDEVWSTTSPPRTTTNTAYLDIPCDVTVGHFARECQILNIVGRVIRHISDPTSDQAFHFEEEQQLQRTLMSFLNVLVDQELERGTYCSAFGMASCALITLHASKYNMLNGQQDFNEISNALDFVEPISGKILYYSQKIQGNPDMINYSEASPFNPYSLYQAAVVQHRLWKYKHNISYKEGFDALRRNLGYLKKRWQIAAKYQEDLGEEWPPLILDNMKELPNLSLIE